MKPFLLLLVCGIVGGGAYLAWKKPWVLNSNSTRIRSNLNYQAKVSPKKIPAAASSNFFGSISTTKEGDKVSIDILQRANLPSGEWITSKILRSKGGPIPVGTSEVSLATIAVGYTNAAVFKDHSFPVHPKIYSGNLQPLSPTEVEKLKVRSLPFRGAFPIVEFSFQTTNMPSVKMMDFAVFDGRTQWSLTRGYSSYLTENGFKYTSDIELWHQTPLEVMVTMALGPAQEFRMKPEPGAELTFPGGVIKVLEVLDRRVLSWGSGSWGRGTNTITLGLAPLDQSRKEEGSVAFLCYPRAVGMPIDIQFIDLDDKGMGSGSGGGTSDNVSIASFSGSPDRIKEIRIKFYPDIYRLIYELNELPGLPEENRNLENLFDARIPYLQVRQEYELYQQLRNLIQLNLVTVPIVFPPGYFPKVYTNITPHVLAKEISTRLPKNRGHLVVNEETNQLEVQPTTLERIWLQFKKKVLGK